MFVEYLSERQQSALLHYAYEIMRADKVVEAEEQVRLEALRAQAQPHVRAEDVPMDELSTLFEDRLTRVALMLELVGMGYADDRYSIGESRLIREIAAALDIGDEALALIESWVERQFALLGEAHELMGN